jgi:hypothetical protein
MPTHIDRSRSVALKIGWRRAGAAEALVAAPAAEVGDRFKSPEAPISPSNRGQGRGGIKGLGGRPLTVDHWLKNPFQAGPERRLACYKGIVVSVE